ncbi:helix-turn-helix domain-containing protein [Flavonifractor sp. An91]|uniref:helix-turn-helix domain-containing protein n=1 Tax=Flavonifractor sp. An91 TaxID=1965665 RepID=UPI000B3ADF5C|nr:helix-turn-helix domain-containing protein [Flavonifractor sp. An91]OUN14286.1 XRE family transcriptional regulator [Flavonifractor sp. An91]
MKKQTSFLARNLTVLRQLHKLSQEEVAEAVGVSRQAVAKWESGESAPDIVNCDALAQLYQVSLDNLIHYDDRKTSMSIPPKGKHMFGAVKVGERGQIVLPKRAREVFHIQPGDIIVVLGDENPEMAGIALVKGETILQSTDLLRRALRAVDEEDAP